MSHTTEDGTAEANRASCAMVRTVAFVCLPVAVVAVSRVLSQLALAILFTLRPLASVGAACTARVLGLLEDVRALAMKSAVLPLTLVGCALARFQLAFALLLVVLPIAPEALAALCRRAARKVSLAKSLEA